MANKITPELHQAFLDVFRKLPGNISYASRECHVTRGMARRAWQKGWPDKGFRPIRECLEIEAGEARAARYRTEDDARRKAIEAKAAQDAAAKQDAIRALAAEGAAVSLLRGNVLSLNAMTAQLLQTAQAAAEKLSQFLAALIAKVDSGQVNAQTLDLLDQVSRLLDRLVRTCAMATGDALAAERVRLGQPLQHAGLSTSNDRTTEQIIADINVLVRSAQKLADLPAGTATLVNDPGPMTNGTQP